MTRIGLACCLLASLSVPARAAPAVTFDGGVGGGYDDNLNTAQSSDQREGSGFAAAWLTVGVSKKVLDDTRLSLSGGYAGTDYTSVGDLSANGFHVKAALRYSMGESLLITLAPRAGLRYYGDSDRNAAAYGVALSARGELLPRVVALASYGYTHNAADAEAFSYDANRFGVGGEVRVGQKGYLTIGYALEFSQSPFYQLATVPIPLNGRGRRPSSTFGTNQVVFKADTTSHIATLDWDQTLYKGIYLQIGYAYTSVHSDLGDYRDNLVSGGVGYRL